MKYIWIDSLCIIQDSDGNQDWIREALRMSQVYGCFYLKIAAQSSETAEGGLFRERDPIAVSGVTLKPHGIEKEGYYVAPQTVVRLFSI